MTCPSSYSWWPLSNKLATANRVHVVQEYQNTGDNTRRNSGRHHPKSMFPEENQTCENLMQMERETNSWTGFINPVIWRRRRKLEFRSCVSSRNYMGNSTQLSQNISSLATRTEQNAVESDNKSIITWADDTQQVGRIYVGFYSPIKHNL